VARPPFDIDAPTRVIFVRHGNVHNPRNLIYGRLPRFRLSERGVGDIRRTAEYLREVPLAAIYSSPLLRARQSAALLAATHPGVPLRFTRWLIEVHTSWQGENNQITEEIRGFSYYDPLKGEGDETILDVFTRMDRALRMVLRRHPGQITVCVSHGDPIKILRIGYAGKELTAANVRAPDPGQASMVCFDFWDTDALPVISALDLSQIDLLVAGRHLREQPPGEGTPVAVSTEQATTNSLPGPPGDPGSRPQSATETPVT
jgi:broad specificity phosphatase PhoE